MRNKFCAGALLSILLVILVGCSTSTPNSVSGNNNTEISETPAETLSDSEVKRMYSNPSLKNGIWMQESVAKIGNRGLQPWISSNAGNHLDFRKRITNDYFKKLVILSAAFYKAGVARIAEKITDFRE